jgi:hypothetical protein
MTTEQDWEEPGPKYIVFKADDYAHWMKDGRRIQQLPQEVGDAVVIRLKDPFASTALYTYCNTIMSFLELMDDRDATMTEDERQRMLEIADYFHGQAMDSEKIKGKRLPD